MDLGQRLIYRGLRALYRWQERIERRLTPLGRFVLAAGFGAGVLGMDTRLNLLHQLFALAAALLLVSGLSAGWTELRLRGRFQARRLLPRFAGVGTTFSYPVRIDGGGRLAPGLFVEEQLPDPRPSLDGFLRAPRDRGGAGNPIDEALGYPRWRRLIQRGRWAEKAKPRPLSAPSVQGAHTESLDLLPLRRGYLRLPRLLLSRPDPLGLFRANLRLPCEQSLLVLPRRYPVRRLTLPGRRQYQAGGMTLASAIGDSQEFIGLREYRAGDSLRNIHWPSWARSGKPQVKEYQDEFFTRHALILDTFTDQPDDPRFEAAVSAASSLCESIQDGESLLDLMFVGADAYCFTGGRGLAGTEQFLEILACAQPCADQPFERLRQGVAGRAGALSAAVVILLDFDQPRRALLRALEAAGLPLLALLVAEEGEAGPLLAGWGGEPPRLLRPDRLAEDLAAL